MTATALVYGFGHTRRPHRWEPVHPALVILDWDEERTDIHGVAGGQNRPAADGSRIYSFTCACGWEGPECRAEFDASAAIISHSLHTCASCGGEKPAQTIDGQMDVFPRCSACAF